jgi:hypothetical protein
MKRQKVFSYWWVLGLLSFMLLVLAPGIGHAATFLVNSFSDAAAVNPVTGCDSTLGAGICTLRSTIQAANASPLPDTMILSTGTYTLTIAPAIADTTGLNGSLDINGLGGELIITGSGAALTVIDGGALDTVFETQVAAVATISGVTIRNGNNIVGLGGGIHVRNGTTVKLNNAVVTANKAGGAAPGAGGVDNSGTLTMDTVAVTNNDSTNGGVNNGAGTLTWTNGVVSGNINGGGIQNKAAMTLTNITISGNSTLGQGGGIDNTAGTLTLQNVTVSGNTAAGVLARGGIENLAIASVNNTIISGNAPVNCAGAISGVNNIDSGATCAIVGANNVSSTDPLLDPLADNGGLLKTHALRVGSPAINTGAAAGCPATDARTFFARSGFAPCDKGAFEFRPQRITVAPASSFDFGLVKTGSTVDHLVTLGNAGDGPLVISGPTPTTGIAVADPLALPFSIVSDLCSLQTLTTIPLPVVHATCTITARFAPTAVAAAADTFSIPSSDPATPLVTYSLSGVGSATAVPSIAVTDSIPPANDHTIPFGGVAISASADATVTVTNNGTADLVLGTIAPIAAPFSIINDFCSGKTLAASQSCTLTVRFAPTAGGNASGTFNIPGAGVTAVTMTVNGTGGTVTGANNAPSNPVLVFPGNGQAGMGSKVTFIWNKSVDPDVDAIKYHFSNCTDQAMTLGCQSVDVVASAAPFGLLFAGLGSMGAGIILIGFIAGSGRKRSRMMMPVITLLLLMGVLFISCGKKNSDEPLPVTPPVGANQLSNDVLGLAPATTYYWKVVADDAKGGTSSSEVWSYTTR